MDGDHVGGVSGICNVGVAWQVNVAPSNGTTTETKAKDREPTFQAEEAFFEPNASGMSFGEDLVAKAEGFFGDHLTSFRPDFGMVLPVTSMHFCARYSW
ncbi:MAG: hypothetical protein IPI67_30300 [Myxococcales bacterium]|nr:hypothetical protein [Myxococcales bacterium]